MVRSDAELTLAESDAPLHERLAQSITQLIQGGRYRPGERLPTHRELARQAGVAIGTVTKAIDLLSSRGLVRGEVGRGTFISGSPGMSGGQAVPSTAAPVDLTLNLPPLMVEEALFLAAGERAVRKATTIPSAGLYDLRGTAEQRTVLADWLGRTRLDAEAEELLLCVGAQQGIHLAFADLRRHSRQIACEGATFAGAISAAADLEMSWQPVDHDEEGMIPDALDRVLAETACRIVYATPVCQNPLGFEVGEARRRDILRVCARHDAHIVEDDIYGFYAARGRVTYKQLAPDRVYYLTSLSKCLTPLVRVGVVVPPAGRMAALTRRLRAQVYTAPPLALAFGCALIELGADRIAADALRAEAKARTALAADLLGLNSVPMPEGSPHLWLPMPAVEAEKLARRSSEHGVRLTPPDASSIAGGKSGDGRSAGEKSAGEKSAGVRLCILAPPRREDLESALKTIVRLRNDPEETVV